MRLASALAADPLAANFYIRNPMTIADSQAINQLLKPSVIQLFGIAVVMRHWSQKTSTARRRIPLTPHIDICCQQKYVPADDRLMATDCRSILQSICLRWPSPLRVDRRDAAATVEGWASCRKPINQP